MLNRFVFIIACFVALPSFAQEAAKQPSWMPKSFPYSFDLGDVSVAKISADNKTVQFARPKLEYVMGTREVQKTVMTTETKTRKVIVDGKEQRQDYTFQVPVTVAEQHTYNIRRPLGSERFEVGIDKIKAWDLAGKAIDGAELAAKLKAPASVIAKEDDPKNFKAIDPFYLSVLRPDTIMIYIPVGSSGPPPAPAAPAPAAPTPTVGPPKVK